MEGDKETSSRAGISVQAGGQGGRRGDRRMAMVRGEREGQIRAGQGVWA